MPHVLDGSSIRMRKQAYLSLLTIRKTLFCPREFTYSWNYYDDVSKYKCSTLCKKVFVLFVCDEVSRPSQPNGGHVKRGQFT